MQMSSFCPPVPRLRLAFAVAATAVVLVTVPPGDIAVLALVPPTSMFGRSRSDVERRHCASGFATSIGGLKEAGGEGPEPDLTNEKRGRERVNACGGTERPSFFGGHDLRRDAERWSQPAPVGSNVRPALPRVSLRRMHPRRELPCGSPLMGSSVAPAATRISGHCTASLGPLCARRDDGAEERKEGSAVSDDDDDDDVVDKFDGGGFVGYLAPYAAALIASIAVTAAFLNFLLTEY